METVPYNGITVHMGNCSPERVGCPPKAAGPGGERQSWGQSPRPHPPAGTPGLPAPLSVCRSLRRHSFASGLAS